MRRFKLFILLLLLVAWVGCDQKTSKSDWDINDQQYLETPGFNVLVFHDYYPEGDQGGIEFIHHGERTATNGYINVELPGGEDFRDLKPPQERLIKEKRKFMPQ